MPGAIWKYAQLVGPASSRCRHPSGCRGGDPLLRGHLMLRDSFAIRNRMLPHAILRTELIEMKR